MKRKISIAILILFTLSLLTAGCSAKSSLAPDNGAASKSTADGTAFGGGTQPVDSLKKIIKDASLFLTVRSADESFTQISEWASANGASEFDRNVTSSGKNKRVTVVYKIAPDKLDAFLDYLSTAGTVTNSIVKSTDITEQYFDAQARLDNQKRGRDQLLEVQKKAVTIAEILQVQAELTKITGEIEALQGKINLWDKLIAESTLTLTITEESDPLKPSGSVSWKFSSLSDIWQTIKNGFTTTVNTLSTIAVWLLIIIASLSPLIAIIAVVLIIARKRRKSKKIAGK